MEGVLPNQGKGRVAEHYARMSVNHEKYLFQVLGQPIHTLSHLDLKGQAYGHHDCPKPDHRACH